MRAQITACNEKEKGEQKAQNTKDGNDIASIMLESEKAIFNSEPYANS